MKLLPVKEWAEKNGIKRMDAINLARNGKLGAKKIEVLVTRWFVPDERTARKITVVNSRGRKVEKWEIK